MSRPSSSSRSRLRRLMVVVLAGLSPMVVPAGVTPAGAASYPLYSSQPAGGDGRHAAHGQEGPRPPAPDALLQVAVHREHANFAEEVRALALAGDRLFLGGFFGGLVDGYAQARHAGDALPGRARRLHRQGRPPTRPSPATPPPTAPSRRWSRRPSGNRLYVGGRFSRIGGGVGQPRRRPRPADRAARPDVQPAGARRGRAHHALSRRPPLHRRGVPQGRLDAKFPGVAALDADDGSLVPGWKPPKNYGGSFIKKAATHDREPPGRRRHHRRDRRRRDAPRRRDVRALRPTPRSEDPKAKRYGGFIALNTSDGRLSSWHPVNNRPVHRMAMSPDGEHASTSPKAAAAGGSGRSSPGGSERPLWIGRVDGDVLGDHRHRQAGLRRRPLRRRGAQPRRPSASSTSRPTASKSGTHHRHLVAFDLHGQVRPEVDGPGRHRRRARPSCWPARRRSTSAATSRTSCRSRSSTAARGSPTRASPCSRPN